MSRVLVLVYLLSGTLETKSETTSVNQKSETTSVNQKSETTSVNQKSETTSVHKKSFNSSNFGVDKLSPNRTVRVEPYVASHHLLNVSTSSLDFSQLTTALISPCHPQNLVDDFTLVEVIRLVFKGNVESENLPYQVYGLLESFLTRACRVLTTRAGCQWSYTLSSTLQSFSWENRTTYLDFQIKHTAQEEISHIFKKLQLRDFVYQNSGLDLVAECWPSRRCQTWLSAPEPDTWSVLSKNVGVVTSVAVVCSLCLVVMLTGAVFVLLRGKYKDQCSRDLDVGDISDRPFNDHIRNVSPSHPQVLRGEMVHEKSPNPSSAEDNEDSDVCSTWVIPLKQLPGDDEAIIVVTTQDTKL